MPKPTLESPLMLLVVAGVVIALFLTVGVQLLHYFQSVTAAFSAAVP